jgi:hypothetical protein
LLSRLPSRGAALAVSALAPEAKRMTVRVRKNEYGELAVEGGAKPRHKIGLVPQTTRGLFFMQKKTTQKGRQARGKETKQIAKFLPVVYHTRTPIRDVFLCCVYTERVL